MNKTGWIIVLVSGLVIMYLTSKNIELSNEVNMLKNQETYAFVEAGKLFDAGNLSRALQSYSAFIRDFPQSNHIDKAYSQIEDLKQRINTLEREKQIEELALRIKSDALTAPEWAPILKGRTMNEIRDLLGVPDSSHNDGMAWVYHRKFRSLAGNRNFLVINFGRDGNVKTFQETFSGTPIRP